MAKKELPFAPPDWPALNAKTWPLGKIKPYPNNPRTHPEAQVAKLAELMKRWGVDQPIVVDEKGVILKGHGRLEAAHRAGFEEFPVVQHLGLSADEKRAMRIADNQVALLSSWDEDLLRGEVHELSHSGFDIGLLGFRNAELSTFAYDNPDERADEIAPDLPSNPFVRLGDIWTLGQHRLMCGDSTDKNDVAALLRDHQPVLMVTDPPYGVNYDPGWRSRAGVNLNAKKLGKVSNDDRADWSAAWILFPGSVAYIWHAGLFASTVQASLETAGFSVCGQIMWVKDRFALSRGDYHWQHEPCWYAVRKGHKHNWQGDRSQSTRWDIPAREDDGVGHGTQKPVECMRRPMLNNSVPGDIVYDPFVGSGTSIIAAETTSRRCVAMELSPSYVQVAIERWQNFTGKTATLGVQSSSDVKRGRERNAKGNSRKSVRGRNGAARPNRTVA